MILTNNSSDISGLMKPFTIVIDFMRTYQIHFGAFSFSFMDVFVWTLFASIAIWFIHKIQN